MYSCIYWLNHIDQNSNLIVTDKEIDGASFQKPEVKGCLNSAFLLEIPISYIPELTQPGDVSHYLAEASFFRLIRCYINVWELNIYYTWKLQISVTPTDCPLCIFWWCLLEQGWAEAIKGLILRGKRLQECFACPFSNRSQSMNSFFYIYI